MRSLGIRSATVFYNVFVDDALDAATTSHARESFAADFPKTRSPVDFR
jgi:hypothetical protein